MKGKRRWHRPETAVLRDLRASLAHGEPLGTWISGGFIEFPNCWITIMSGSLYLNCSCEQGGSGWTSTFLLGIWNFGMWSEKIPMWLAPNKNPGHWVSIERPGQTVFPMYCHSSLLEEVSASCMTPPPPPPGRGLLDVHTWPPLDRPMCHLPSLICSVSSGVLSLNHEYKRVLRPVSPPSGSLVWACPWELSIQGTQQETELCVQQDHREKD